MGAGRPTDYRAEYAEQAYKLCLLGATDKEMADFWDTSEQTVNSWKTRYPKFLESIKKGKTYADANVADRLYQRAIGYEHPEIITASFQGEITDVKTVTKHYPPDTAAAMAWLKNRRKRKENDWNASDRVQSENINHNFDDDVSDKSLEEVNARIEELYKKMHNDA